MGALTSESNCYYILQVSSFFLLYFPLFFFPLLYVSLFYFFLTISSSLYFYTKTPDADIRPFAFADTDGH